MTPAYAADTGATTAMNQYVALKYDGSNNQNEKTERINGTRQTVTTFGGQKYIKVNSGVTDTAGRPVFYWVREGYSLTMVDGQPYTSLSSNGRRADVSWTGDANAKPSDILESVTSTHVQTNVTTNVGETLQQVNAGTYAGVTNSGGTEVAGTWDYIVKDSSWKGGVDASNYRDGYANLISKGKPKGFVTTGADSKLAWNATLNAYTYNGKVVDYSNIYVIDGEIGVFTNASGSEVYTGTVFGKNNEVLMTVKKSDGNYYSYWGAEVNDAGATMDTYRVAEYQKDLNVLRDNDFALYHNDIKSVDMSTNDSSATISLMRNGDGTSSPAVDGTLTITNGGGADDKDTYVRISNTTNGQKVSKDFSTGSKVSAIGSTDATTGLTINGVDYTIKAGKDYKAGENIQISADNTISAKDNYVTSGSISGDTITLNRALGGEVTITGLKEYVEGKDSYVTSASLKDNKLAITQNNNKGNYEIDLSGFADQFSGTDYRVVANPAKDSGGIYKPDANGNIELTVQDTKTGATSTVKLSDVASATTVNNNYTTLDTKIDKTKTDITNAYTTTINETKNTITNEYKKYVADTEDYVTSGSISGDTITLNRALGGEVTITGLKEYVEGKDSYVTSASLKDNKLAITQNNNKGNYEIDLSGFADQFSGTDYRVVANPAKDSGGIYKPDANGNIELTVQDTKTGATSTVQLSDVASAATVTQNYNTLNTKVEAAKTTLANGTNTTVESSMAKDGHTEYKVNLNKDVNLGDTIQLNGSDGSISAKSGGARLSFNNNGLTVSQAKNGVTNETRINGAEITVDGGIGNQTTIKGSMASIGSVLVNGGGGTATISGLTNKTTKYAGFATSGRAATEEQLKEVSGQASEAITTANKGWNLTTNGAASKTNIAPDGTVDFSSGDGNLVISNAGANLSFSLSDNLDLTQNDAKTGSVKVGENTALSNERLQVGTSSLTTSALMVGGLTYINSSGINANSRVISNVAAGIADTDAVNVSQLKSAISGSQVSIKAGDGISVAKTGNQYTINVNIEGVTNNQGKVTVSTGDSTSTESGSESGSSGAKKSQVMDLMYRTESNEVAPETTTDTGKAIQIESIPEDIKLEADDNQVASVVNGETIKIAGDGTNISTAATVTESGSMDTISVSLKPDIQVDSVTINNGGPTINSSGIDMNSQKITNLADGEIAEGSTDAVNGGQLYNTNQAVIANAENINSLSHSLNKLDSRINRVGAGAAALAALHPLDFDPDNKWDFAAGYGNYAGANAVAIGTYYRPNENTMFSIGGSFGGGENMVNAGVSFKLGSGGSGITTSKTVMAKKIKEQDELLKAQDAKMKEQDEKIAKLEALVAQQGEMIRQALGKK